MDKLKFIPIHYWNKETMQLSDSPTDEQWAEVEAITNALDAKYKFEEGCLFHPDKVQKFCVGLFNGYVDIQIQKSDTCYCQKIVERMIDIRNDEWAILNPKQ